MSPRTSRRHIGTIGRKQIRSSWLIAREVILSVSKINTSSTASATSGRSNRNHSALEKLGPGGEAPQSESKQRRAKSMYTAAQFSAIYKLTFQIFTKCWDFLKHRVS